MNNNVYRRLPLVMAGVLAILAFSSTSAFAAGKPVVTASWASDVSLTTVRFSGTVNPNGAATTYKLEYGTTESLGASTSEVSVGSGTSAVSITADIKGLLPKSNYYIRLMAKNSYGTVYSKELLTNTGEWWIEPVEKAVWPAEYGAEKGTLEIAFDPARFEGHDVRITCESTGYGKFGNPAGSGDEYNIEPHKCGVFYDGVKKCSATLPWRLPLNERLVLPGSLFTVSTPTGCFLGEEVELFVTEPFQLEFYGFKQPQVEFKSNLKFGIYTATIKDKATWQLLGADYGDLFGVQG